MKPISPHKKLAFSVTTFLISSLLLILVMETMLRIVPNSWSVRKFDHLPDATLGWVNPSGSVQLVSSPDFNVMVSTNRYGMRDREREIDKDKKEKFRIAVLGDSATQAIQVKDREVFTRLMEEASKEIDVLNFGVSGYGATQELLQYRLLVRRFSPDLVIVMVSPFNDPFDNSIELQRRTGMRSTDIYLRPFFV